MCGFWEEKKGKETKDEERKKDGEKELFIHGLSLSKVFRRLKG